MSQEVIVAFEKVNKFFKSHHVLKDISFSVKQGEVLALIGPSGSGKSTCLRTINALETVTSGSLTVCGIPYRKSSLPLHKIRRNTGMIFQKFELFPHLTARENVALGLKLILGKPAADALDLATDFLQRVGLASHADKYPRDLSGGQQQRVAIARALAIQPKILLCDEPTSALDPELVDEVVDILTDVARSGMTMIIVTHELYFARKVSHRTLFLEEGSIIESGETAALFEQPQTSRLASFLKRVSHGEI